MFSKKSKRISKKRFHFWTWSHRLVAALFLTLLVLGHQPWFPWFHGSPTGTRLLEVVPFVDPLAALEVMVASRQVVGTMLLGAALVALVSILFGRVFCGWLCPLGLLLDLNDAVRTWIDRRLHHLFKRRLPDRSLPRELKYWLLLFLLVVSSIAALPAFTTISPINLMVLAIVSVPGWELALVGGIVSMEYAMPRVFCRAICPLGALHCLLGRFGSWRVRIQPESGTQLFCRLCSKLCPMGIKVLELHVDAGKPAVDDPECTRCGVCTDGCLGNMLHLGLTTARFDPTTSPVCEISSPCGEEEITLCE